jgi:hypothetical protein
LPYAFSATNAVALSSVEPLLLREGWFQPEVASCLRSHLRHMLLTMMLDQAENKELPGAKNAAVDVADYEAQLEVQRKTVQEGGAE